MQKISLQQSKRQCDGCRACCYSIGVAEIDKPQWKNCKHECDAGCVVFDSQERPPTCSSWSCAWLLGMTPEDCKPDRCGLVVSPVPSAASIAKMAHFYVVENYENAHLNELSKKLIEELAAKFVVVLRLFKKNNIRFFGPENLIEVFKKNVEING